MTQVMHDNQHSQHPKKHKKQPETWKQVSQWMAEDSRVEREINQVDKQKRLGINKREDVQIKRLITAPCEAI